MTQFDLFLSQEREESLWNDIELNYWDKQSLKLGLNLSPNILAVQEKKFNETLHCQCQPCKTIQRNKCSATWVGADSIVNYTQIVPTDTGK